VESDHAAFQRRPSARPRVRSQLARERNRRLGRLGRRVHEPCRSQLHPHREGNRAERKRRLGAAGGDLSARGWLPASGGHQQGRRLRDPLDPRQIGPRDRVSPTTYRKRSFERVVPSSRADISGRATKCATQAIGVDDARRRRGCVGPSDTPPTAGQPTSRYGRRPVSAATGGLRGSGRDARTRRTEILIAGPSLAFQ
jgi:hypothetical protein